MPPRSKKTAVLGLEASLWEAANRLRSSMDAAEYKHIVLGLIFLKYVSDLFDAHHNRIVKRDPDRCTRQLAVADLRAEYSSAGVFWIPEGHRWDDLLFKSALPEIGDHIDNAMEAVEQANPALCGVLPRNYSRRELTPAMLRGLIEAFSRDDLLAAERTDLDVLGRVYEYFLGQFASAEGRQGGEFYTPRTVVQLLVEMIEPYSGRVYDPACGSGGMFVQADAFVQAHGGSRGDISVFGQEQNPTTWRLAKMNLALRGIEADLGDKWGDSFLNDKHPDLLADYILANPPFNISKWGGDELRSDKRWKFGVPPESNANFAWIQHMVHHLAPNGSMGTVLANGSLSSTQNGEGEIRKRLVEADLVECIVALPTQLFYTTPIPVCLWILAADKNARADEHGGSRRDRRGEVLFIDARELGRMTSRTTRDLSPGDISKIAETYRSWRGRPDLKPYGDVAGFCGSVNLEVLRQHNHILSPSRYVGMNRVGTDESALAEENQRLMAQVRQRFSERVQAQEGVLKSFADLMRPEESTWQRVRIGDVAKVVGGGTPPTSDPDNFGGEVPWVTPKDLTAHVGRYISRGARSLSQQGFARSSAKLLPKNALLVSSRAPIGLVALAEDSLATNQGIRSLILDETQVPEFWYYLLRLATSLLDAHANGTTFREISGGSLANISIMVPDQPRQQYIADMLGALDAEIENNLRVNESLARLVSANSSHLLGRALHGDL
ncbi:N-6 DNA methylase [Micromonospora sp. NPDC050980]|uniref:N-6 DNA methylase n=1 Tax=Micromonospora sp. NPDC050980 TaxID=3155161 RepID=UPI00340D299D